MILLELFDYFHYFYCHQIKWMLLQHNSNRISSFFISAGLYTSATLPKYSIFAEITDDILKFDGFIFRKTNEYKDTSYWRCISKYASCRCNCRVITEIINGYQMIKTLKGTHKHTSNLEQYEQKVDVTQFSFTV